MIKEIRIQNLRSIKDSGNIKLKPIMILLGANSTGKSTFLRSFPLFTQSVAKNLRGPIAWFDNAFVDYGDYKTALNKYVDEKEGITFSYKLSSLSFLFRLRPFHTSGYVDDTLIESINVSFKLRGDNNGTYVSHICIKFNDVDFEFYIKDRNDSVECKINNTVVEVSDKIEFSTNTTFGILPSLVLKSSDENKTINNVIEKKLVLYFKKLCDSKLHNLQRLESLFHYGSLDKENFLHFLKKANGIKSLARHLKNWTTTTSDYNNIYQYFLLLKVNTIIELINKELALYYYRCDYIAPMRAEAGRYYRIQGLQVQSVDPTGHNLLEFIASLNNKEKTSYDKFVKDILGVTVDVPSESGMKSLRLKTENNGDFNIADVGYGYSQVLPVITKLWHVTFTALNADNSWKYREIAKSTILMEQPELHLHPAMQAKVADLLVKTINETRKTNHNTTLIIETHSQALINRIGRRIREEKLSPDEVNVLLFQKDNDFKNSIINQISFTENGQLKDWPYGFFDPLD